MVLFESILFKTRMTEYEVCQALLAAQLDSCLGKLFERVNAFFLMCAGTNAA